VERPQRETMADSAPRSTHWTPRLEAVARRAMMQATGFSWMYERQVSRAKKWGNALTIAAGFLGALVGTRGVCAAAAPASQGPSWASFVDAGAGYLIAVLLVLDGTWKLDVVRSQGLVAQVDFAHLARSVQFQLALRPEERQDAREFVKGVLGEIETLKLSSPTLDGADKRAYAAKFRDNPIYGSPRPWEGPPPEVGAPLDAEEPPAPPAAPPAPPPRDPPGPATPRTEGREPRAPPPFGDDSPPRGADGCPLCSWCREPPPARRARAAPPAAPPPALLGRPRGPEARAPPGIQAMLSGYEDRCSAATP
jgi:hypothetical protein